ncbi:thioredoxin-like protein 1 [Pezoporus flaviventris]|uniref:thioredoxin-like protein 1 n=1 Tax=Pezoporus flaviventris TaxID=889875 RepID=UPI002AB183B1|nr:thioredoxin-like protein 1 [Pezoporus flaviventris]
MGGVKVIGNDAEFQPELGAAGSRLAVVKRGAFPMGCRDHSQWDHPDGSVPCARSCGPCLRIAPAFSSLSTKYPQAAFLEVDVHQCQGTAASNNIAATPTFLFFRNKVRVDQYQGADPMGLEEKIKQHLENEAGNGEAADIPKGYMDLLPFVNRAGCECLNESDEHGFENCLRKDASYLESDCDEQLLMTVAFSQPVKLYSMKFQGPDNGQGPKSVKLFINLPRSMDFAEAERSEPTQALELSPEDIREAGSIPLRYVKFQNVNSVTLFVQSNHGAEATTRVTYFTFIGTPVQATNMNDFKRVVGKKGESH